MWARPRQNEVELFPVHQPLYVRVSSSVKRISRWKFESFFGLKNFCFFAIYRPKNYLRLDSIGVHAFYFQWNCFHFEFITIRPYSQQCMQWYIYIWNLLRRRSHKIGHDTSKHGLMWYNQNISLWEKCLNNAVNTLQKIEIWFAMWITVFPDRWMEKKLFYFWFWIKKKHFLQFVLITPRKLLRETIVYLFVCQAFTNSGVYFI